MPLSLVNPWVILGIVLAIGAAGAGGYVKGHSDGVTKEHDAWTTRENQINVETAVKIAAADKKVSDLEHAHATRIAAVDANFEWAKKENQNALQSALAKSATPTGKLYGHSACPAPAGNASSSPTSSPGSSDGPARAVLSDTDAVFLLNFAAECDGIVNQLAGAQAVILEDRAVK